MKSLLHRIILSLFIIMMPHLAFAQSTKIDEHADMMGGYSVEDTHTQWERERFIEITKGVVLEVTDDGPRIVQGSTIGSDSTHFWNERSTITTVLVPAFRIDLMKLLL